MYYNKRFVFPATIIHSDKVNDLSIIKINSPKFNTFKKNTHLS